MELPGPPHEALFLALSYLPLEQLITMTQVCKSFRDAVRTDVLIWLDIIIESPLSLRITDEILFKIVSKADGRLQTLALLNCLRITDAGLMNVIKENPSISKLYLPSCTGLTPEGVTAAVTTLAERSNCLTSVKISGMYNLNQHHLQTLKSHLPNMTIQKPRFYHKYRNSSFHIIDEDTHPIDAEICPKCKEVKLVFDCPKETCTNECKGCVNCFPRCEGCGGCVRDGEDEQGETICKDYLCINCWLGFPKCNYCNRPFCPRHEVERKEVGGFVCGECQDAALRFCMRALTV